MSVTFCKYCERQIDTDYNAEHEDECELNPDNVELPTLEAFKESKTWEEYESYLQAKIGGQLNQEQTEQALNEWGELIYKYHN